MATNEWVETYTEEAYAVLGVEWSEPGRIAPNGFAFETLMQDLSKL